MCNPEEESFRKGEGDSACRAAGERREHEVRGGPIGPCGAVVGTWAFPPSHSRSLSGGRAEQRSAQTDLSYSKPALWRPGAGGQGGAERDGGARLGWQCGGGDKERVSQCFLKPGVMVLADSRTCVPALGRTGL